MNLLCMLACSSLEFGKPQPIANLEQPILEPHPEAEDINPSPDIVEINLVASKKQHEIVNWKKGETIVIDGYAYNDLLPGPTIRAKIGDQVIVHLQNDLDMPTTIHWHGLQVPEDMDGVPWNREPIQAGESFEYRFTVEQAGTFWYHPHFDTEHQVNRGLYGAFIVEDPADPEPIGIPLIFDDWNFPYQEDSIDTEFFQTKYVEGLWTVNGLVQPKLDLGENSRLRLINVSNSGYLDLDKDDSYWIASDQGKKAQATNLEQLLLVPGDRADILTKRGVLQAFPYSHKGGERFGEPFPLLTLESTEQSPSIDGWAFSDKQASIDPQKTDGYFSFQGDPRTRAWYINGEQFPDITIQEFELGSEQVIEVRNISAVDHPFHIHGLVFEILSRNGVVPEFQEIEDTINIRPFERIRLLITMDNAGDWMTHCHILPHAEDGMMTVLRVQ